MSSPESLPFRASIEEYQEQADALFERLKSHDQAAEWRFKWQHPRFRGKSVAGVRAAALELSDAQAVIAHEHSFQNWADLVSFTKASRQNRSLIQFEAAVEAVISGDAAALRAMLREHPELVRAR